MDEEANEVAAAQLPSLPFLGEANKVASEQLPSLPSLVAGQSMFDQELLQGSIGVDAFSQGDVQMLWH